MPAPAAPASKAITGHGDDEADLYPGYGRDIAPGTSLDAGLLYNWFPDARGRADYFEPYVSVSHTLGPVEATHGAKYAWRQRAIGSDDMLYCSARSRRASPQRPSPSPPRRDGRNSGALGRYWNWSLGGR